MHQPQPSQSSAQPTAGNQHPVDVKGKKVLLWCKAPADPDPVKVRPGDRIEWQPPRDSSVQIRIGPSHKGTPPGRSFKPTVVSSAQPGASASVTVEAGAQPGAYKYDSWLVDADGNECHSDPKIVVQP